MRKTSVYLFLIVLYWFIMMQAILHAQTQPKFEHTQTMHQYILREGYRLLQREAPGSAARLANHMGTADPGSHPWEMKTVMSGVFREDAEDVVYGHGGPIQAQQPGFDLGRNGNCLEVVYDELAKLFKEDPQAKQGFVSVTHFWDPDAPNRVVTKGDIRIDIDAGLSCLNTNNQTVMITPAANAWEKIQRLLRPNWQLAIRDRWWTAGETMYNAANTPILTLPAQYSALYDVRIRYNTLAELYNTGACSIELPGSNLAVPVVLTTTQRERYVWEILGRACHLLGDMSVPAHTHKDMHMGNISISEKLLGIAIRVDVKDDDSYESWMGSTANALWTADMIQAGLVPLIGVSDPLYHLMSTMRSMAASFASDDFDGTGQYISTPRSIVDIPNRHNFPADVTAQKRNMMMAIRDNTLPYAIRATATLLQWFVAQLNMPVDYRVWTMGAAGYNDFFVRDNSSQPFPTVGTQSGTRFYKQSGDPLSLRSHTSPHSLTSSKSFCWTDENKRFTVSHQWDDVVLEKQGDVESWYKSSEVYQVPQLNILDEHSTPLSQIYPTFRNPWHVDPSMSDAWNLEQPNRFDFYKPTPATDANGGIFLSLYDELSPPIDYYSIRASQVLDANTKAHKWPSREVGDYCFVGWENLYAKLLPDPKNIASPPIPAYANAEEYDTKIVDFMDRNAVVNAHYKAHRTSDRVQPPTNVNSQRKVARDARGFYHAVYESGGRIWYVRSTDHGVSWSNEERVSDIAAAAARPSIAAMGDAAWITCVQDGQVVVRIRGSKGWETLYSAPVTMKDDCTPAIAVLGDYSGAAGRGPAICLVWEDTYEIRFTLIQQGRAILDNQLLAAGHTNPGGIDQPRYPSVAASTMTPSPTAMDHGFHFAWIENGSIYYANLAVERRTDPITIWGWQPRGAYTVETVHARTGSVGLAYPARHAPSVAVTTQGVVHVAFDVTNWYSPWPVNSVGVGTPGSPTGTAPNSMFAVCERSLAMLHTPVWLTTTTLIGGSSNSTLCSPSVATKPPMLGAGTKSNALRVLYNDRFGQLRVARFEGGLTLDFHAEGWDPSVTDYAPTVDGLVDVYSYTAQQPYTWHLLSSQNNLAKTSNNKLLRMRQLLLSFDESVAALGLSMPRLRAGEEIRPIEWNEAHDSLVIGLNSTVQEKLRTAVFTPNAGEKLLLDVERFGVNITDTQSEILLRINDAKNGEALRVVSMPLNAFASAAAMAVQEFDLSAVSGTAVFISADVYTPGEKWSAAVVDRYAIAEETQDAELEKSTETAAPGRPVLKQNHPNPFNPSTSINYHLLEAGKVRIAVYNLLGQEVALLEDGWVSAGDHALRFDGSDLPSGVYLYRLESAGATFTRSMHLVK